MMADGCGFLLEGDESILKLDCGHSCKLDCGDSCEYTKKHQIVL